MSSRERRSHQSAERAGAGTDQAPTPEHSHLGTIGAVGVGVLAFAVYVLTLCPTVPGGDGAELVTAAYTTAVAHPPGYPLYTLLAKAFTRLPFGSIAWRVNLLSAVYGAWASVFLYLGALRWGRNPWAAFLAAGLFAFSPLVWRYSVVAEVFPLNHLFIAVLIYMTLRYSQDREPWIPYAGAFLFGLGLSNHHALLFYGFPFCLWVFLLWLARTPRRWPAALVAFGLLLLLGLLPYLYLPYAASLHRMSSWGDAGTLSGFWHHFLRRDVGTFNLGNPDLAGRASLGRAVATYLGAAPGELLYGGPLLACIGLVARYRRERFSGFAAVSVAAFAFYLVVFGSLANLPIEQEFYYDIYSRFWPQTNLLVCLWAGMGFAALFPRRERLHAGGARVLDAGLRLLAVLLVALQIALHYRAEDQSRNRLFHMFGSTVLRSLPEKALLLTKGDLWVNTIRYLQLCEGVRPDVCLIDLEFFKAEWTKPLVERHYSHIAIPGKAYRPDALYRPGRGYVRIVDMFDANVPHVPVFVNRFRKADDLVWPGKYKTLPVGFLHRVLPEGTPFDIDAYMKESEAAFQGFEPDFSSVHIRPGSWESLVREAYCDSLDVRSGVIVNYANEHGNDPALLKDVVKIQKLILRLHSDPPPLYYKNLGIVCFRLKQKEPAFAPDMVQAWSAYLVRAPLDDPDLPAIRRELAPYVRPAPRLPGIELPGAGGAPGAGK